MSVLSSELLSPEIEAEGAAGEAARRLAHARIQETKYSEFHALDLVLGIGYEQSPIIALDGRGTASNENPARPGFRLPHAWLPSGQSIFDELGPGLTLLSPDGREARESAVFEDACRARNVPLRALDLAASGLGSRYGARLILVRPDQHVAWCGDGAPDDAGALIDHVCGVS